MYVCTLYMYVCEYVCISSADMLNTSDEKKKMGEREREKNPFSEFSDYISKIEKLIYMFENMQPSFFVHFSWFQSILQGRAQRFLLSTFPSG